MAVPFRKLVVGSMGVGYSTSLVGLGVGGLLVLRLRVLRVMVGWIALDNLNFRTAAP